MWVGAFYDTWKHSSGSLHPHKNFTHLEFLMLSQSLLKSDVESKKINGTIKKSYLPAREKTEKNT